MCILNGCRMCEMFSDMPFIYGIVAVVIVVLSLASVVVVPGRSVSVMLDEVFVVQTTHTRHQTTLLHATPGFKPFTVFLNLVECFHVLLCLLSLTQDKDVTVTITQTPLPSLKKGSHLT